MPKPKIRFVGWMKWPIQIQRMKKWKKEKKKIFKQVFFNQNIRFICQKLWPVCLSSTYVYRDKISTFKISKNNKFPFFSCPKKPSAKKKRFLCQKLWSVPNEQTDTQKLGYWVPYQGFSYYLLLPMPMIWAVHNAQC